MLVHEIEITNSAMVPEGCHLITEIVQRTPFDGPHTFPA